MFRCTEFEKQYFDNASNTQVIISGYEDSDGYFVEEIEIWGDSEEGINKGREFVYNRHDDSLYHSELQNAKIEYHSKRRYSAYSLKCSVSFA